MSLLQNTGYVKADFTAGGSAGGVVTVASTITFRVGSHVWISGTGLTTIEAVIWDITSPTTMVLCPTTNNLGRVDLSSYTVVAGSAITQPEQTNFVNGATGSAGDVDSAVGGGFEGASSAVYGPNAVASAPTVPPVLSAGIDGTNVRTFRLFDLDTGAGTQYVQGVNLRKSANGGSVELGTAAEPVVVGGPVADGVASTQNPVIMGGVDGGGLAQSIAVNTDGEIGIHDGGNVISVDDAAGSLTVDDGGVALMVQGGAADGVAVAGNPILIAGTQGGTTQTVNVDATGNIGIHDAGNVITVDGTVGVQGPVADGIASTQNPVIIGGVDGGGLAQAVLVDASGNIGTTVTGEVSVKGPVADGVASTQNPVIMGGVDGGGLAQSIAVNTDGEIGIHDGGNVISVDDGAASLTVDSAQLPAALTAGGNLKTEVVEALPAGTNAIGKLASNSGVDIGDVDVLSSALPTGAATEATLATLALGTQLPAALDGNGGLKIGDNGQSLTVDDGGTSLSVDGTVTVQGPVADGAASTQNPVIMGGVDGSANAQTLAVSTTGAVIVAGSTAVGGGAYSGNPVTVSGEDGSGVVWPVPVCNIGVSNAGNAQGLVICGISTTNTPRKFRLDTIGGTFAAEDKKAWAQAATTDAYATLDTVWDKTGLFNGSIYVKNTGGANSANYTITASLDGGSNYDVTLVNDQTLAFGTGAETTLTKYYTHIKIEIKATAAGNQTNVVARGCAISV